MKRYLVFHGTVYYLGRGFDDLVLETDSREEAVSKARYFFLKDEGYCEWARVYDLETRGYLELTEEGEEAGSLWIEGIAYGVFNLQGTRTGRWKAGEVTCENSG